MSSKRKKIFFIVNLPFFSYKDRQGPSPKTLPLPALLVFWAILDESVERPSLQRLLGQQGPVQGEHLGQQNKEQLPHDGEAAEKLLCLLY